LTSPHARCALAQYADLDRGGDIEIVCRDRARSYAEAARIGAPHAQQIADRSHVWRNLAKAVEKTVGAHHACVKIAYADQPDEQSQDSPAQTTATLPDGRLDVRGRERKRDRLAALLPTIERVLGPDHPARWPPGTTSPPGQGRRKGRDAASRDDDI
jgi:transposase